MHLLLTDGNVHVTRYMCTHRCHAEKFDYSCAATGACTVAQATWPFCQGVTACFISCALNTVILIRPTIWVPHVLFDAGVTRTKFLVHPPTLTTELK